MFTIHTSQHKCIYPEDGGVIISDENIPPSDKYYVINEWARQKFTMTFSHFSEDEEEHFIKRFYRAEFLKPDGTTKLSYDIGMTIVSKQVMDDLLKDVIFKAKIKGKNEWIEGNSLIYDYKKQEYMISYGGMSHINGNRWSGTRREYIEKETLIIER